MEDSELSGYEEEVWRSRRTDVTNNVTTVPKISKTSIISRANNAKT